MAASLIPKTSLRLAVSPTPIRSESLCGCAYRQAQHSRQISYQQRNQAPAPLFLDFLAPSHQTRSIARRPDVQPSNKPTFHRQRRTLSSTAAQKARAIANPRKDEEGEEMTINITPRAAHRLQAIAEKDGNPSLALRVSVESGGCHGFQYLMSLVDTSSIDEAEDTLFENEELAREQNKSSGEQATYKAKVVMDEPSLELLKGSSIDYTMELIGSQFKVTGIPGAKSSCGCGTSFDIAA